MPKAKRTFLLFLFLSVFLKGLSQTEDPQAENVLDELFALDSLAVNEILQGVKKDALYLNLGFDEQAYFSGRDFGLEQYSLQPSLTYIKGNHLFFNLGSAYYSGLNPQWDLVSLSVGYFTPLDKKKRWNTSLLYGRIFFTDQAEQLNQNRLSASLNYRYKSLKLRVATGYLFGGNSSYYLSQSTTGEFVLVNEKKWSWRFSPALRFLWSQQLFTEEITSGRFGQFVTTIEQEVFDLINVELEFPFNIDVGPWDATLSYQFNFPKSLPNEQAVENTSFFSFRLGYMIDF